MKLTQAWMLRFAQIKWLALAAIALTGLWTDASQAADRSALAAAANSITKEELTTHVDTLADDTFEGREAGSRGGRAAGNYLLQTLEAHDLKPAGDSNTFFQSFNGNCRNVLALLEGSDPALKHQVVQIGAHYDHVGYGRATNSFGPFGYIHNGADDNASGVAGMLEIIDAVKKLPQPPRRSVLFCFWDSEENGLIGSRHWLSRPTIPLDRVVFSINIDMIGRMRDNKLEVGGTRTAPGLRRLISEACPENAAVLDFTWKMKADSDHWPFFERRIPVVMFHTGLHNEYHRPSDDAHLINHDGLRTSAQVALFTLLHVADADQPPTFRANSLRESVGNQQLLEQPVAAPAPRYGFPFKAANEEGQPLQIVVSSVNAGGPAEQGGLKAGDVLVAFQGEPIEDTQRFRLRLLAASGETTFLVQREGEPEPVKLKVTPRGNPVRIGISWRMDDGEPGTAVVTQVTFGSAAQAAGLALKDRIYAVADQSFTTQEDFSRLLRESPSPIDLVVERSGKLQTLQLEVIDDGLPSAE